LTKVYQISFSGATWKIPPKKLLERARTELVERVREAILTKHYSPRTEQTYIEWIRRFILFHKKRHPAEMGAPEVQAFISFLAVERQVSASTKNPCTESGKVRLSAPVTLAHNYPNASREFAW
jgi:hypothetical protein